MTKDKSCDSQYVAADELCVPQSVNTHVLDFYSPVAQGFNMCIQWHIMFTVSPGIYQHLTCRSECVNY